MNKKDDSGWIGDKPYCAGCRLETLDEDNSQHGIKTLRASMPDKLEGDDIKANKLTRRKAKETEMTTPKSKPGGDRGLRYSVAGGYGNIPSVKSVSQVRTNAVIAASDKKSSGVGKKDLSSGFQSPATASPIDHFEHTLTFFVSHGKMPYDWATPLKDWQAVKAYAK